MATKSVTILPAAAQAAGCTATCTMFDRNDDGESGWIEYYQLSASAVFPWRFVRFEYTTVDWRPTGSTSTDWTQTENPTPPQQQQIDAVGRALIDSETYYPPGGPLVQHVTLTNIVAVFATRTPTNLLVNSSNRSTPVQLVYDDRAGHTAQLVADY